MGPTTSQHNFGGVFVRLLALEIEKDGAETYHVSFSVEPNGAFRAGLMKHQGGLSWNVMQGPDVLCANVLCGSPDEVFVLALGEGSQTQAELDAKVKEGAPHWPTLLTQRLARRRLAGAGTIVFDANWFSGKLATSAMDRPLLFPNATAKLGLDDLVRASGVLRRFAKADEKRTETADLVLPHALLAALSAEATAAGYLDWDGEGRLIGEYMNGELGQIGTDIADGCRAAVGTGPLQVVFKPSEPMGLGLGPLQFADTNDKIENPDSVGWGAEVGEIDAHGAAERAGVLPGMALSHLSHPDMLLSSQGRHRMTFEAVLEEIDERRADGDDLSITFTTAASVTHLYAVEMPATAALEAFALAVGVAPPTKLFDVGVSLALKGCAPLWREDTPRLFLGEPGSLTCAHTDICPQLEVAHGLIGLKLLGVASYEATPRLYTEHGEGEDEEATRIPTDRALTLRQSRLLGDADVTIALLLEGDLAVFDSGALHFASNGKEGFSGALYHGMITPAAVPRLRQAAANDAKHPSLATDGYQDHLFAADLLRIVEPLLHLSLKP
jgi:hypothetical protein